MLKKKQRKKLIKIPWFLRLGIVEDASAENLTIWASSMSILQVSRVLSPCKKT
jgi:hypothetical protein